MIYTLVSLFAFLDASTASRRLLQAQGPPEFVPIGNPPAPETTGAVSPQTTAGVVPAPQTTAAVTNPGGVVLPGQGGPGGKGPFTLPPLPIAPPLEMECVVPYTAVGTCAGSYKTIPNPGRNFKLNCAAVGGCAQSSFTFDYLPGGRIDRIEGIWFSEGYAGWGSTITINNQQVGQVVKLEELGCTTATACQDLTIVLINADLNDVNCPYPSYCAGCVVKQGPLDPNPKPCFGW